MLLGIIVAWWKNDSKRLLDRLYSTSRGRNWNLSFRCFLLSKVGYHHGNFYCRCSKSLLSIFTRLRLASTRSLLTVIIFFFVDTLSNACHSILFTYLLLCIATCTTNNIILLNYEYLFHTNISLFIFQILGNYFILHYFVHYFTKRRIALKR